MTDELENIHVRSSEALITPDELKRQLPVSERARRTVLEGRRAVQAILEGRDPRLCIVVGPCSIHDPRAALDYAQRLAALAVELSDSLLLVMRVYFEKPRTTVGWKGLVNDPHMDDSFAIEEGLHVARRLLLDVAELGVPAATEALDPISPQYLHDLISWSAIGARTSESQTHREMSSGLSSPVGFKNGTDGSLTVALNALHSVSRPHSFLGMSREGRVAVVHTTGNPYAHVVLRGGAGKPNYDAASVAQAESALLRERLPLNLMVDASHENSGKDPLRQLDVISEVARQIEAGNRSIMGLMIESHLELGKQTIPADLALLRYGVSVTDACLDWARTEDALRRLRERVRGVLPGRVRTAR
jgi:3-deoxy-7-phosphoheptulonate synthase